MPFVADDFRLPEPLVTDRYTLRPITVDDAVKDYDAVMTSVERLRDVYYRAPGWPSDDLSLMQNLIDLAWHHKERQLLRSFCYIAVTPDDQVELACIYIDPPVKEGFDVEIQFWVRESEAETGLDADIYDRLRAWITSTWPWERAAYPGREYTREEWDRLPDR